MKMKYNEIPISKKVENRDFVTFSLDRKTVEKFNDLSSYYGHGGKRRLIEYLINNAELFIDFPRGKQLENQKKT